MDSFGISLTHEKEMKHLGQTLGQDHVNDRSEYRNFERYLTVVWLYMICTPYVL